MKFEWDSQKVKINEHKHKVTFLEFCYVFSDKYLLTEFDNEHSNVEDRWITIGQTPNNKIFVVIHTFRNVNGEERIRIISARKATKNEVKQYFERRG